MRSLHFLGLASLLLAGAPAIAQQAPRQKVGPAQANTVAVVADIRRILAANYVRPDVRPALDAVLATGLASGRYRVNDPAELANLLNEDLASVAHDKHLNIHYDPKEQAELATQPPGAGADDAPPTEAEIQQAVRANHGISTLQVLPGNIRYMDYRGFIWAGPKTAQSLDNAMRFLHDGDAVIIDLRRNGGGSPEAVQYLVSHFLEPNRKIVTFYMHGNAASPLSSLASLPAGRMVGKPLYVLTSAMTASAAEEFTGHVAGFKLGELIGETTAGAGYRNEFFPVTGGFVMSVSVGRAVLASTGKDWEGVGIPPNTKIEADKALNVAQVHALRRLAESASPDQKPKLEAYARLLEAQATPIPAGLDLAQYAGTYGERIIDLINGSLALRRNGGPRLAIVPVGAHRFLFVDDPATSITFTVAGTAVTGFEMMRSDGSRVEAQRQP